MLLAILSPNVQYHASGIPGQGEGPKSADTQRRGIDTLVTSKRPLRRLGKAIFNISNDLLRSVYR
jgi:hypothetical protein